MDLRLSKFSCMLIFNLTHAFAKGVMKLSVACTETTCLSSQLALFLGTCRANRREVLVEQGAALRAVVNLGIGGGDGPVGGVQGLDVVLRQESPLRLALGLAGATAPL